MKFKAEDFIFLMYQTTVQCKILDPQEAADLANARLQEMLNEAPVVMNDENDEEAVGWWFEAGKIMSMVTRRGRLVCVEDIPGSKKIVKDKKE